jgi:hypothetical protein
MDRVILTPRQVSVIEADPDSRLFLSGPAGCGKTTAGVERLRRLLDAGVPGDRILMLTPQRTLQEPYLDVIRDPALIPGGPVAPSTVGGLARRVVDLFWPLAAEPAGFAHPDRQPVFLTLETAQYYMARLVRPLLEQGYFESVTIDRNRLYAQILDNLNKSAAIGFPHDEIGARLDAAYQGEPAQRRVYADAQDCASRFRDYCLEHNLLDFSLQLEIFWNILWPDERVRRWLTDTYRHLIYDNVEEDVPRAHDLVRAWLPDFDSALLIYDEGGGYRKFLGADIESGWSLRDLCTEQAVLQESFVGSPAVLALERSLEAAILAEDPPDLDDDPRQALAFVRRPGTENEFPRFYPELLDAVADETIRLCDSGLPPSEIVILAPYLSDALRFSMMNRLAERGVPARSHRPSRSLREEPASRALLTLAALAHPGWKIHPPKFDVCYALAQSVDGLDLVRAQLLTEITYRQRELALTPFDVIKPDVQERITFVFGARYTQLRDWLLAYREETPLPFDHFLRRLFGEVLSQEGFGFHSRFDSVRVAASLIESARKFRQALEPALDDSRELADLGREYSFMLQEGVIAAQYLEGWQTEDRDAVLVAPAHTFLMMNRPVRVQFWLDAGSGGWYERLSQPLTQPYILSRGWEPGRIWGDADEVAASRDALARLATGLVRRCRERVYLGLAELGESGFEQRGELLKAFQRLLQGGEE